MVAFGAATAAEWAAWLAVLVDAHQRSGTAAAGWTALGLLLPAVVAAPFASRSSASRHPVRSLTAVHATQAASLAGAAVSIVVGAPLLVAVVLVGIAIGGNAVVRSSYPVIAPGLVATAQELTGSNLLAGYCEAGCVLLGPILATLFLAWGGPAGAVFACAALTALATWCTLSIHRRGGVGVRVVDSGEEVERPSMWHVLVSLRRHANVPSLLGVLWIRQFVTGAVGLLFVVLAVDTLGMSGSGAGALNIAFGIGSVAATIAATALIGRPRVSPLAVLSLAASVGSLVLLSVVTTLTVALLALAAVGACGTMIDVASKVLLQRSAPPRFLASVFAFVEVATSVGLATGTAAAQIAIATLGPRGTLAVMGAIEGAVMLLTLRRVWRADRAADVPVVQLALLRSMPLFAPLSPSVLETVARAADERRIAQGDALIVEGEPGHSYFAIAGGTLDVSVGGVTRRQVTRGDGVGEIALLDDVPRTATVRAVTPVTVFEIDRASFLLAVTGNERAAAAAKAHIATLQR